MDALSREQQEQKNKITWGAIAWGLVAALVLGLLMFWVLGNAPTWVRWVMALIVGAGAGWFTYRWRYNSGVAKAICRKCGTAFGIDEVERHERVVSSEQRTKTAPGRGATASEPATNRITTWTEERVEITAIDECLRCHDRTARKWTTTREANKEEVEVPAQSAAL